MHWAMSTANPAGASVPTTRNIPDKPHQPAYRDLKITLAIELDEKAMIIVPKVYMKRYGVPGLGVETRHRPDHFRMLATVLGIPYSLWPPDLNTRWRKTVTRWRKIVAGRFCLTSLVCYCNWLFDKKHSST